MKIFRKFGFVQGLALGLAGSSFLAYAVVTLPHTFTSGTTISSAEVNANFQALKSAIDDLQLGLTSSWDPASSTNSLTCANNTYTPSTWTTVDILADGTNLDFNSTSKEYSIPITGAYQIFIEAPSSAVTGSPTLSKRLMINSADTGSPATVKHFTAGDLVRLEVGCGDGYASGSTYTIDKTKFFFGLRKI